MPGPYILPLDSSKYTAIKANSYCRAVFIVEDNQAGTTDYKLSPTGSDADAITIPAGAKCPPFSKAGGYSPTDLIGYAKPVSGTPNFDQFENP